MAKSGAKVSATVNAAMLRASAADMRRFWRNVSKTSSCWLWQSTRNHGGYGTFRLPGRCVMAHRLALVRHSGIAPMQHALHSCHNSCCVNPKHLRWGSPYENAQDAKKIQRYIRASGEDHVQAKLTNKDVVKIFKDHLRGHRIVDIAKRFRVHHATVSGIVRGRSWDAVTKAIGKPVPAKKWLTEEDVRKIWVVYAKTKDVKHTARVCKVLRGRVEGIIKRKIYKKHTKGLRAVDISHNHSNKLSSAECVKIANLYLAGSAIADIARKYNVGYNAIKYRLLQAKLLKPR